MVLDAFHRNTIVEALRATRSRTSATMLIAPHEVPLARAVADDVAVLSGGRIVFHGAPDIALRSLGGWYQADIGASVEADLGPSATAQTPRRRR